MLYYNDLTEDQRKQIIEQYQDGTGSDTIAKQFDCPPNTILRVLKKANIARRPLSQFTNNDIQQMISLYKDEKKSLAEVGEAFNVTGGAINKIFKKHNIARRSAEEAHRKYAINEDFFDNIDTEEKAYMLGFIFADGCNQMKWYWSISITIDIIDDEILYKFANLIFIDKEEAKRQVKYYDRRHEGKGIEAHISINSKHMCQKISDLGCVSNKTFLLTYPKWLPQNLHRHFIRGYFDGDGTINSIDKAASGCKMVGTKEFCDGVKNVLANANIASTIGKVDETTETNTWGIYISGNRNIQKILHFMYDGSSIYLGRKHQRYLEFNEKMRIIDEKTLAGTQGFSKSNIYKNYYDFFEPITVNGITLDKQTVALLSNEEKQNIAYDIFDYFRSIGFIIYTRRNVLDEYKYLCETNPDITSLQVSGTSRSCANICKQYCEAFYKTSMKDELSIYDAFMNDDLLLKVIKNRLCISWKTKENFEISMNSIIKGFHSSGLSYNISLFKPMVAKYMYMRYSNISDTVYDYAAGWGGRMLGAAACGRKYIGIDPLTIASLERIQNDLKLENIILKSGVSENMILDENSIDFSFSSPPYFDLEIYSQDTSQAYNKGEDYFYNTYWRKTLENIKHMLKPNKWFGLNVDIKHNKMIDITKEYFGDIIEEVEMMMPRFHMNRHLGGKKSENIYMFTNRKDTSIYTSTPPSSPF